MQLLHFMLSSWTPYASPAEIQPVIGIRTRLASHLGLLRGVLTLPTGMLLLQIPRSRQASVDFLDRISAIPDLLDSLDGILRALDGRGPIYSIVTSTLGHWFVLRLVDRLFHTTSR